MHHFYFCLISVLARKWCIQIFLYAQFQIKRYFLATFPSEFFYYGKNWNGQKNILKHSSLSSCLVTAGDYSNCKKFPISFDHIFFHFFKWHFCHFKICHNRRNTSAEHNLVHVNCFSNEKSSFSVISFFWFQNFTS